MISINILNTVSLVFEKIVKIDQQRGSREMWGRGGECQCVTEEARVSISAGCTLYMLLPWVVWWGGRGIECIFHLPFSKQPPVTLYCKRKLNLICLISFIARY